MTKKPPNLRDQQKQETRERLRLSAMKLFVRDGYENVSLKEIAEDADIHVQTLFKHFKNKKSLATASFDTFYEQASFVLEGLEPNQNVYRVVKKTLLNYLRSVVRTPQSLALFKMIHRNEDLISYTQYKMKAYEDALTNAFLKQEGWNSLDAKKARLLAAMIMSAQRDAHFQWIYSDGEVNSVDQLMEYFKIIDQTVDFFAP